MVIRIRLTKPMLVAAKLAALLQMPEAEEQISECIDVDSDEELDLDLSMIGAERAQELGMALGLFAIGQKVKESETN